MLRVLIAGVIAIFVFTQARILKGQSIYEPYAFGKLAGAPLNPGSIDATAGAARFTQPWGVAVDGAGNVYVADSLNHTIRKIGPGGVVTTLAGTAGTAGFNDGAANTALFSRPTGLAVNSAGTVIYVADGNNHVIREISGGTVTTVAGAAGSPGATDATGTLAQFRFPFGVALNSAGSALYVTDQKNQTIRSITLPGGVVSTFAGSPGVGGTQDDPSNNLNARFNEPRGIAIDSNNHLYVADTGNFTVRKIMLSGGVSTIAGTPSVAGSTDGPGNVALFSALFTMSPFGGPCGVAVDASFNVYVADQGNRIIRKITPLGNVTTLAGTVGVSGSADGTGVAAQFNYPGGVAVDASGILYVADTANHTIRVGTLVDCVPGETWTAREANREWFSVATSADGSKMVALDRGGKIYTSSNFGVTWTPHENNRNWRSVTSSSDGSKLVAVEQGGQIYTSTDYGVSWTPRENNRNWYSVATSCDGNNLVAVALNDHIYTSTDSGVSWTPRESTRQWMSVASSCDGSHLVAVVLSGRIYTSIDFGVTWTPRDANRLWISVASSSDGSKLVAVENGGQIYTSTDAGATWTPRESNRTWVSVASSADGMNLVALAITGQIYTSTDFGVTWTAQESVRNWRAVASSADGTKLVAIEQTGQIYTSECEEPPTITCAADKTVECGTAWNFDAPSVIAGCAGGIASVTVVQTTTNGAPCAQTFTRLWMVQDGCGNSVECSQTVTVVDTLPPVLTCAPDKTVECGSTWSFDPPTAFDNCLGTTNTMISVGMTETNSIPCGQTITRTWRTIDNCGNSSQCSQTVTITDTTPPTLTCVPNKTVVCGSSWTFDPPIATDNCSGTNVTITVFQTSTNGVDCARVFTRTWTAVDDCGNTNLCSQTVTETDTNGCLLIANGTLTCSTNGAYSYTFSVTNHFWAPVAYLSFVDLPDGVTIASNPLPLPSVLQPGEGTVVTVSINSEGPLPEKMCFRIAAHNEDFFICCVVEHCIAPPDCCALIANECLTPNPNGAGGWTYTFDLTNLSGSPVQYLYLVTDPFVVAIPPINFGTSLASGQTTQVTVNIPPISGAESICFKVSTHTANFVACCSFRHCVELPNSCAPRTYTFDADFDEGYAVNLNHTNIHDQLQVNPKTATFPYVWIAASGRGTVVKIDTITGAILGEYLSAPDGRGRNPSRTTVDRFGNCWVANRNEDFFSGSIQGSVTRYAIIVGGTRVDAAGIPNINGQYLKPPFIYNSGAWDRDGDGLIKTSRGSGDILAWTNLALADDNGGVSTSEDEAVITYVRTAGAGARTLVVDANNDLWVGGADTTIHEKYTGQTGAFHTGDPTLNPSAIPGTLFSIGYGGYGGVMGLNNVLWSARSGGGLLRLDATTMLGAGLGNTHGDYGIAIDACTGNIWQSQALDTSTWSANVFVRNPAGVVIGGPYPQGSFGAQGLSVDQSDNVFVAHGIWYGVAATVGHLRTDGTFVGNIPLTWGSTNGLSPTGVAVDSAGKIWASCLGTHNVMRIDPNAGPLGGGNFPVGAVDLAVDLNAFAFTPPAAQNINASPYNYSDQTGYNILGATAPGGWWNIVRDGGTPGMDWGKISWHSVEPAGTSIKVEVRAEDNVLALPSQPWTEVMNGQSFCETGMTGQYLEVRVLLSKSNACAESPALLDLTVDCCATSSCAATNHAPNVVICPEPISFPGSNAPVSVTINASFHDQDGDPLTVTWTEANSAPYQTDTIPGGAPAATSGSLSFTHTFAPGTHVITIMVDDGIAKGQPCHVTVTIGDQSEVVVTIPKGISVPAFEAVIPNFLPGVIAMRGQTRVELLDLKQTPAAGLIVNQGVHVIAFSARVWPSNTWSQTFYAVKPVVKISSLVNYQDITQPTTVSVALTDSNITDVARVTLRYGEVVIGTDETAPYTFLLDNLEPRAYVLTAVAESTSGLLSISTGVIVSIRGGVAPTNVVIRPALRNVEITNQQFTFQLATETGVVYVVEGSDGLMNNWTVSETIPGDGTVHTLSYPTERITKRFYRVRVLQD